jgi:hypothetical protein
MNAYRKSHLRSSRPDRGRTAVPSNTGVLISDMSKSVLPRHVLLQCCWRALLERYTLLHLEHLKVVTIIKTKVMMLGRIKGRMMIMWPIEFFVLQGIWCLTV